VGAETPFDPKASTCGVTSFIKKFRNHSARQKRFLDGFNKFREKRKNAAAKARI
jgi:hypothetical protein